ncbi:MAG: DUF4156 domain-containing protein [Dokdonella sp.]
MTTRSIAAIVLSSTCLSLTLTACSWGIKLQPAGKDVRVAWNDDVSVCKQLGEITVSVLDHVGPVDRNDIKVRDELEVMARNEAVTMDADTIKPMGDPRDGEQSWSGYDCKGVAPATREPTRPTDGAPVEKDTKTFPIEPDPIKRDPIEH